MPSYRDPSPDAGHEAIRAPLAAAIDELTDHVSRLDDAFLLSEVTADFAQSTLDAITAMQDAGTQMQSALANLTARVAALEAASPTTAPPDPSAAQSPGYSAG